MTEADALWGNLEETMLLSPIHEADCVGTREADYFVQPHVYYRTKPQVGNSSGLCEPCSDIAMHMLDLVYKSEPIEDETFSLTNEIQREQ